MDFFMNISTNCTSEAMTRINAMVFRYVSSSGTRMKWYTSQVNRDASAMTNMTAMPMPAAVSTLLDTPRNGQQPRKREKM